MSATDPVGDLSRAGIPARSSSCNADGPIFPRWRLDGVFNIHARNEADQAIYQAEKSLRDLGENVPALDQSKIAAQINTLKETMPSDNAGHIRAQIAELQQAMMVLGQAMYGDPERPGGDSHTEPRDEDVIEGEYQEM